MATASTATGMSPATGTRALEAPAAAPGASEVADPVLLPGAEPGLPLPGAGVGAALGACEGLRPAAELSDGPAAAIRAVS